MFRKVVVCRWDVFFRLKTLLFGKQCDEVVQVKSRGIRKAIFREELTYSESAESQLSPKPSLTTICELYLLLSVPDRRGHFPSLWRSWCQFCRYFNIKTNHVEDRKCSDINEVIIIQTSPIRFALSWFWSTLRPCFSKDAKFFGRSTSKTLLPLSSWR